METIRLQELSKNQNSIQTYEKKAYHLYSPPTMEQLKKILGKASRKESIIADQQITKFIESKERKIILPESHKEDDINKYLSLESGRFYSSLEGDDFVYFVESDYSNSGNINENDSNQEFPKIPPNRQRD